MFYSLKRFLQFMLLFLSVVSFNVVHIYRLGTENEEDSRTVLRIRGLVVDLIKTQQTY
jgi:hypothetical protein